MAAGLITSLLFAGRHNHNRMPRILLIDDDEHLAAPLASYFARFDCVLESAPAAQRGPGQAAGRTPTTPPSST